jgi:hypothetical protein
MANGNVPAPCEGAGSLGGTKPQDQTDHRPPWAWPEISDRPSAISYAAELALEYAEAVHDFDAEDRGRLFPNAIRERCADPLLLMRFLPFDVTQAVRREAERKLRTW